MAIVLFTKEKDYCLADINLCHEDNYLFLNVRNVWICG